MSSYVSTRTNIISAVLLIQDVENAYSDFVSRDTRGLDMVLLHLDRHLTNAEASTRGYAIVGDESYLRRYHTAAPLVEKYRIEMVEQLNQDNVESDTAVRISELVQTRMKLLQVTIDQRRAAGFDAARTALISGRGDAIMTEADDLIDQLLIRVQASLKESMLQTQKSFKTLWIYLGVGLATIFAASFVSLISSGTCNARALEAQNAQLHTLLIKAEEATRIKDMFLANVSHEIRTPMVSCSRYCNS